MHRDLAVGGHVGGDGELDIGVAGGELAGRPALGREEQLRALDVIVDVNVRVDVRIESRGPLGVDGEGGADAEESGEVQSGNAGREEGDFASVERTSEGIVEPERTEEVHVETDEETKVF